MFNFLFQFTGRSTALHLKLKHNQRFVKNFSSLGLTEAEILERRRGGWG